MDDPFSVLLNSLKSVFSLETMRNGKYSYKAIQQLKEATEQYNPKADNTFDNLFRALENSIPHIAKNIANRRINFDSIKIAMDELAKIHQMEQIDWTKVLSHPKVELKFQFSALHHSTKKPDLNSWLTTKTGKPMFQQEPMEITQELIKNMKDIDSYGFSQTLSNYLKKYPDFLFQLIMDSETIFCEICRSRLILFLTDQQIAKAIIKHIPTLVHTNTDPFEQVNQLIQSLNSTLSNGRSVSTLLRNAEAKPILFNSIYFQLYQSEGYTNRQTQTSPSEDISESKIINPEF